MFSAKILDITEMQKPNYYLIKVEYSNGNKSFIKDYEFNAAATTDVEASFNATIEVELNRITDLYNEIPSLLLKIGTEIKL